MAGAAVLLIDEGDLPSLVTVALESKPQEVILYHVRGSDPAAARREACVKRHGEAFGARQTAIDHPPGLDTGAGPPRAGLLEAGLLLRAATAASGLGCTRIVWPRHVGPDAGLVGEAVERANMVAALAELGSGEPPGGGLIIDLPVVDLTDAQLVDLADDGGAPMRAFWPCGAGGRQPCGICPGCQRWQRAFDDAGAGWPWAAVTV